MKRRISVFLILVLVFTMFVFPMYHSAHAIAMSTALLTIIIATLAAMGITVAASGGINATRDYIEGQFESYAADIGETPTSLLRGAQTGTNKLGQVILNNRMLVVIEAFALWLKAKWQLANNGNYTVQNGGAYWGDYEFNTGTFQWSGKLASGGLSAEVEAYAISSGAPFVVTNASGALTANYTALFVWNAPFTIYSYYKRSSTVRYDGSIAAVEYLDTGYYYAVAEGGYPGTATNKPSYHTYLDDTVTVLDNLLGESMVTQGSVTVRTGTITLPSDDPDYVAGDGAILDIGASWGLTYDDVMDDLGEDYGDTTITYDDESTLTDQVSSTEAESVSSNPSDYAVTGLADVFPFCIPFDLYNFLECLDAEAEAPAFTWRIYVPDVVDEEVEVDLSEFEALAQVIRIMELLLFCVGLAFVTRKLIRG